MSKNNERSQWFLNRSARPPAGDEFGEQLDRLRNPDSTESTAAQIPHPPRFAWEPLGPTNFAGRCTCLAIDPQNPKKVFLGSASGGLWLSEDEGINWEPQTDALRSLSIGAVALAPGESGITYLGTGEANLSVDSFPGAGIYRLDPIKVPDQQGEFKSRPIEIGTLEGRPNLPNRIGAIAVDPFDDGHVFVASATIVDDDASGLYEGRRRPDADSFDWNFVTGYAFRHVEEAPSGKSRLELPASGPYRCYSVIFHPTIKDLLFASVGLRGWRSGIYRSIDGGQTWLQLECGLPSGDRFGRTSLAISGTDETNTVLWAYASHTREGILGVFRTNDLGQSWFSVGQNHFENESSGSFHNCIAVHPAKPDWAICGGKDLHRTMDGGTTWQQITDGALSELHPQFAPSGHHAVAITAEFSVYDANDSGMSFSNDFGSNWIVRNHGLSTTMVFKVDVGEASEMPLVCGLHSVGVLLGGGAVDNFKNELREDVGWVISDPQDSTHVFAAASGSRLYRRTKASEWIDVTPALLTDEEKYEVWLPVIAMDSAAPEAAPHPLFFGTTRLWKSSDYGDNWRPVSIALDGSPVSAIEICPADSRRLYAGTERGAVHTSHDGGNTWSENLGGVDLPYRYITRIATHPKKADHVLVSIGPNPHTGGNETPYEHLFFSTNGGRTWKAANKPGELPDASHNCVAFDAAGTLYVATDFGVYRATWLALEEKYSSWQDISGNLPKTFVMDLVVHTGSGTLTAATWGRGLFRHKLGSEMNT